MGVQANLRISEEKGLFPPFSGFSRCSSHPPEKSEKRQKKGEKCRFWPISRQGGQTPLKPPFVTPHLRQPNKRAYESVAFRQAKGYEKGFGFLRSVEEARSWPLESTAPFN